jgi:hypothetical protein
VGEDDEQDGERSETLDVVSMSHPAPLERP